MFQCKTCDNCKRELTTKDKVTAIIPDVELGKYNKKIDGFRLKLSENSLETRVFKVYCQKCLNVKQHFLETKQSDPDNS